LNLNLLFSRTAPFLLLFISPARLFALPVYA